MITPEPAALPYDFVIPDGPDDPRESFRAWQAHLDAGRIGARPSVAPAIAANSARTVALFRSFHRAGGVW